MGASDPGGRPMYRAPLRELHFVLEELLQASRLNQLPDFADYSSDVADSILEEADQFAATVLDPINRSGDEQGARWTEQGVVAALGFCVVFLLFVVGGWTQLCFFFV